MSSRRDLKKQINNSMSILYNDCMLYKMFYRDANQDKADKLIGQMAKAYQELLSRLSIQEGKEVKGRVNAYYTKLNSDLKTLIDKFGLDIQGLN